VADEDAVLNRDALADERVAGDLAATSDGGALLDLDERSKAAFVADDAPIQIEELAESDAFTEPDIGRNCHVVCRFHM